VKATGRRSRSTALHDLETGDLQMGSLLQKIRRVLDRDVALLITGETGTGKSSLARAVHGASSRAAKPFVSVNCAAMPEAALEVELFGGERDARGEAAPGCIVRADGGTLFLDEVDEMPPAVQARLLQVLQDRCVTPPGARAASPRLDFAIISATRGDLRVRVGAHRLRDALYYRLNGLSLRLPALRERTDLDGLAQRILRFERPESSPRLAAEVMQLFRRHPWPGNLRQFANVLRAAVLMAADEAEITLAHLAEDFLDEAAYPVPRGGATGADDPRVAPRHDVGSHVYAAARGDGATVLAEPHTLEQAEIAMIRAALDAAQGNISAASKQLGISRNTIYRRLRWNAHDRCQ
jgi:transcriptional regulator of acetoin/glycerol metabolism